MNELLGQLLSLLKNLRVIIFFFTFSLLQLLIATSRILSITQAFFKVKLISFSAHYLFIILLWHFWYYLSLFSHPIDHKIGFCLQLLYLSIFNKLKRILKIAKIFLQYHWRLVWIEWRVTIDPILKFILWWLRHLRLNTIFNQNVRLWGSWVIFKYHITLLLLYYYLSTCLLQLKYILK